MGSAKLAIDVPDADGHEVERLTRLLRADLISLGLFSVARDTTPAPPGAKSAGQLAELVVTGTFSVGAITAVTRVINAYIKRTSARSVTWQQGDKKVVFTGISSDDQKRLAEALAEQEAGDDGGPAG